MDRHNGRPWLWLSFEQGIARTVPPEQIGRALPQAFRCLRSALRIETAIENMAFGYVQGGLCTRVGFEKPLHTAQIFTIGNGNILHARMNGGTDRALADADRFNPFFIDASPVSTIMVPLEKLGTDTFMQVPARTSDERILVYLHAERFMRHWYACPGHVAPVRSGFDDAREHSAVFTNSHPGLGYGLPEIYGRQGYGISFSNGRHRTANMAALGASVIPAITDIHSVDYLVEHCGFAQDLKLKAENRVFPRLRLLLP